MVSYIEIEPSHYEQVVALLNQLGYDVPLSELANRIKQISNNREKVFVAVDDDGRVVGCVHALIDTRLAGGTFGEIVSLVVDESIRGKGVGKGLIEEAAAWLKLNGMTRLRVRCNSIRQDTHKFYEHLEFIEKKSQKIFEKLL